MIFGTMALAAAAAHASTEITWCKGTATRRYSTRTPYYVAVEAAKVPIDRRDEFAEYLMNTVTMKEELKKDYIGSKFRFECYSPDYTGMHEGDGKFDTWVAKAQKFGWIVQIEKVRFPHRPQ